MKNVKQENIFSLLLSGKHPEAKKYAGHHVMVIGEEIIPLKSEKYATKELERLEKKYGKTPTLVFVPRQDISYILLVCLK